MEDQMYIIIAKVLHGEASDAERQEFEHWLQADQLHAQTFSEMKTAWNETNTLFDSQDFDASAAWEKVSARIQSTGGKNVISRRILFPSWATYSSAVAALLIIAVLVWHPFRTGMIQVVAATGNRKIELPDHSIITLRKGSSISYPPKFSSAERRISLAGEAFFEVVHNEAQPFIVDAQSVNVRVLGTTFNVACNPNSADVAVLSGRVQVSLPSAEGKKVILTPGISAHYGNGDLSQVNASGYEALWKSDTLSFNGVPFSKVINEIAAVMHANIHLDAALSPQQQQQAITVSFHNQSLEDMLTELCLITQCRWEKPGTDYIVRAK